VIPVIGVDLGPFTICCAVGTWNAPILLRDPAGKWELRKCGDMATACAYIDDLLERRGRCVLAVEQTFSAGTKKRPWLREVGRVQESQAGYLEGVYGYTGPVEFVRVQPCIHIEGMVAWSAFGCPVLVGNTLGEHLRDALCVALKAINQRQGHCAETPGVVSYGR